MVGCLVPLLLGLWQGRNIMAERHGGENKAAHLVRAKKQKDREEESRGKIYPSKSHPLRPTSSN
jgi:hypothetical protein